MKLRAHSYISIVFVLLLSVGVGRGQGLTVRYIGSIREQLQAPVFVDVLVDRVLVVEPFQERLTQYSATGLLRKRIYFRPDISALLQVNASTCLVCESQLRQVRSLDISTGELRPFLSQPAVTRPVDLARTGEHVAVLDASGRILVADLSGTVLQTITLVDAGGHNITHPTALAYDRQDELFYVFDQVTAEVWQFDAAGAFQKRFGGYGAKAGEVTRGVDMCAFAGMVLISDRYQDRIVVYGSDGSFRANVDLQETATGQLFLPSGLAVDESGTVYVASTESGAVHAFRLAVSGDDQADVQLSQLFPVPYDTLSPSEASFTAQYDGPDTLAVNFEFALYLGNDTTSTIAEGVVAPSMDSVMSGRRRSVAEWHPATYLLPDTLYQWRSRLRWGDTVGTWSALSPFYTASLPLRYALHQNYPNPFNPTTTIVFTLPHDDHVRLDVFNILGEQVAVLVDDDLPAGEHRVIWDGHDEAGRQMATGIYFYRLTAGNGDFEQARKMVLLK